MQKFIRNLKDSAAELKNIRSLCTVAMLMALSVVLNMVSTINIGQFIHIGLSWLPKVMISVLFGPVTGAVSAVALDILNYAVRPDGPFFPGFTLGSTVAAFIYGVFFYRKKVTVVRTFVAKGVVTVIDNIILNTLWLSILYGQAFKALFFPRLIKNLITWPIYSLLLFTVMTAVERTKAGELLRAHHYPKAS